MHVAGESFKKIGTALGVPEKTAYDWKRRYPEVWGTECDRCINEFVSQADSNRLPLAAAGDDRNAVMEGLTAMVRMWAGTDAILNDSSVYFSLASRVRKWHDRNGTEMFPANGQQTLATFYRDYYAPLRLADAMPTTKRNHAAILKKWAIITGDPPLLSITSVCLSRFRDCLAAMPGKKRGVKMKAESIRDHLRVVQTILDKAGPPGRGNRDAANTIPAPVPWCKPPQADIPLPRIISPRELAAVYGACDVAKYPVARGVIQPADWWRALIVLAYNTGLRRRTLFEMKWCHVDLNAKTARLPPHTLKSRRWHVIHLNRACIDHLAKITTTPGEHVFQWPHGGSLFDVTFRQIQREAGILEPFGLHNLRKTLATILCAGESPQASQLALGHAGSDVTMKHYVQATGIVAQALDAVPQPWAKDQKDGAV